MLGRQTGGVTGPFHRSCPILSIARDAVPRLANRRGGLARVAAHPSITIPGLPSRRHRDAKLLMLHTPLNVVAQHLGIAAVAGLAVGVERPVRARDGQSTLFKASMAVVVGTGRFRWLVLAGLGVLAAATVLGLWIGARFVI